MSMDDGEASPARQSDRMRRAPGWFHYPELGKPIISSAQILLEECNKVTGSFNDMNDHVLEV